ncbi:chloride channel protein [Glaciecola sp. 1036]|uniref:chloride channel protein n=1 Tax=Alteromonadaceae TaxID=72275 RepID=UPI003D036377
MQKSLLQKLLQHLRKMLSIPSTSIELCLVGLIGGVIAAIVIVLFRGSLTLWHQLMLGEIGNYAYLPDWQRFLLPIVAIGLVLLVALITGFKHYRLGIPFVIHRLKMFYGHIPLPTSVNQFFGGILALGSGFVVGKEGPSVHLAAAASHYVGRWLSLPFNSLRILAGCGIAAGISAAFNTPFAAVIFVMEVVLREYKVHVFIPVMLAAACGSVLTRAVFGDVNELSFLTFTPISGLELLYLVFIGFCIGSMAALFNKQLMLIMAFFRHTNMVARLLIAAVITGAIGYFYPAALGAEFINVEKLLTDSQSFQVLLILFACKFMLATIAIGLGVPGGIVGAVMVIGMLLGMLLIVPLSYIGEVSSVTNYALLGLAGFLATVLHAPMAALSAAMELAADSRVVLPAIIVIVTAYITSKQLWKNSSIFIQQLDFQGLPYASTAIRGMLQYTGVLALIDKNFAVMENVDHEGLYEFLQHTPDQKLIHIKGDEYTQTSIEWVSLSVSLHQNDHALSTQNVTVLTQQHTLADVHDALYNKREGAVVVIDQIANREQHFMSIDEISQQTLRVQNLREQNIMGIITWNMLHTYLLRKQH